jgi:hypothetical protein
LRLRQAGVVSDGLFRSAGNVAHWEAGLVQDRLVGADSETVGQGAQHAQTGLMPPVLKLTQIRVRKVGEARQITLGELIDRPRRLDELAQLP